MFLTKKCDQNEVISFLFLSTSYGIIFPNVDVIMTYFCRELKSCKSKMDGQTKQVAEYTSRLDEYDKKLEENSRKFGTVLAVSIL